MGPLPDTLSSLRAPHMHVGGVAISQNLIYMLERFLSYLGGEEEKPKIEATEEEARDIPYFEHLSDESKKFVLEIKRLSEMSEEEYLKNTPKLAKQLHVASDEYGFTPAQDIQYAKSSQ